MVAKLIETREIIIRCTVIFMGIITIQPPRWSLPFLCILWTHWDQEIPLLWKVTLEKKYISWVLLIGNVMLLCIYHNKLANSLSQLYNNKKRKKTQGRNLCLKSSTRWQSRIYRHVNSDTLTYVCDDNKNTAQSPRFFCIRYSFSS